MSKVPDDLITPLGYISKRCDKDWRLDINVTIKEKNNIIKKYKLDINTYGNMCIGGIVIDPLCIEVIIMDYIMGTAFDIPIKNEELSTDSLYYIKITENSVHNDYLGKLDLDLEDEIPNLIFTEC